MKRVINAAVVKGPSYTKAKSIQRKAKELFDMIEMLDDESYEAYDAAGIYEELDTFIRGLDKIADDLR